MTEPKMLDVSFLELETLPGYGKIKNWLPELEKAIGRSIPKYSTLEGGVYPDKDGVMHCWPGSHYYLCVPTESKPLLAKYGTFSYSIDKPVEDAMFNNQYCIFYWGPGCKPHLEKITEYHRKMYEHDDNN